MIVIYYYLLNHLNPPTGFYQSKKVQQELTYSPNSLLQI